MSEDEFIALVPKYSGTSAGEIRGGVDLVRLLARLEAVAAELPTWAAAIPAWSSPMIASI
jgi:hypothetical protein